MLGLIPRHATLLRRETRLRASRMLRKRVSGSLVGGFTRAADGVIIYETGIRAPMQRTIRIQLQLDKEAIKILTQTIEQYTWSFNAVCKLGWDSNVTNGVTLHKETYYDHRTLTGLPSQLVCAARVKATEALKSARTLLRKNKPVSCPQSKHCSIRYDVAALFARM
jgi:predicted transposase